MGRLAVTLLDWTPFLVNHCIWCCWVSSRPAQGHSPAIFAAFCFYHIRKSVSFQSSPAALLSSSLESTLLDSFLNSFYLRSRKSPPGHECKDRGPTKVQDARSAPNAIFAFACGLKSVLLCHCTWIKECEKKGHVREGANGRSEVLSKLHPSSAYPEPGCVERAPDATRQD